MLGVQITMSRLPCDCDDLAERLFDRGGVADVERRGLARAASFRRPGADPGRLLLLDVEADDVGSHLRRPDGHRFADA